MPLFFLQLFADNRCIAKVDCGKMKLDLENTNF